MLRQVLRKQTEQLGPMHMDTLLTKGDLGGHLVMSSESADFVDEGMQLLQESVDGLNAECGPQHPMTHHYRTKLTSLREVFASRPLP